MCAKCGHTCRGSESGSPITHVAFPEDISEESFTKPRTWEGPLEWQCKCSASCIEARATGGTKNTVKCSGTWSATTPYVILHNTSGKNASVSSDSISIGDRAYRITCALQHLPADPANPAAAGHYVTHVHTPRGWATLDGSRTTIMRDRTVLGVTLLAVSTVEIESGRPFVWSHLRSTLSSEPTPATTRGRRAEADDEPQA